jgi:site-specific recombinase XerD
MAENTALTTIVQSSNVDLAIAGWLDVHKKSARTHKAYQDTIQQFRAGLQRMGKDLDTDVQTLMLSAQAFARGSKNKEQASDATYNLRLATLSSFYDYAMSRYLILPMDNAGHVLNPMRAIKREKIEPYHNAEWLEPEEVTLRLKQINRSTLLGKRDYALLAILFQTGRRLQEVATLQWQHVRITGKKVTLNFEHCKGGKRKQDELPVGYGKALLEWLHAYYGQDLGQLASDTPVWVCLTANTKQYGQALGLRAVQRLCDKYLDTHTHVTRHSFSHAMIKAGATLPELQDRLGHESLATTGIYAKVFTGAKNPHAEKLAQLFGVE